MDTDKQQPENEQPTNANDEMNPVSESGDPDEQVDMDELVKRDADEEE